MTTEGDQVWRDLAAYIRAESGIQIDAGQRAPQGGGCINAAWLIGGVNVAGDPVSVFVKSNRADRIGMFEAEALALAEMAATESIRVPTPICSVTLGEAAFLALEGLNIQSRFDVDSQRKMGIQLAELHRNKSEGGNFGWHRDNVIGETPQPNAWMDSWPAFYAARRLGFQFGLATERGRHFRGAEELMDRVPGFFASYDPIPSLLHGDLWGGNAGFDAETGEPVLFDPATYYGDRETDLAFTELFGGFGPAFYEGYASVWPLDTGYARRKTLYNLYHVLNHDHLFGGGYGSQAQAMMDRLLAE
jgi:fructosamine-3-kinase